MAAKPKNDDRTCGRVATLALVGGVPLTLLFAFGLRRRLVRRIVVATPPDSATNGAVTAISKEKFQEIKNTLDKETRLTKVRFLLPRGIVALPRMAC